MSDVPWAREREILRDLPILGDGEVSPRHMSSEPAVVSSDLVRSRLGVDSPPTHPSAAETIELL